MKNIANAERPKSAGAMSPLAVAWVAEGRADVVQFGQKGCQAFHPYRESDFC